MNSRRLVLLTIFVSLALILPSVAANAAADWQEVGAGSATGGGISDNSGHSTYPAIAVSPVDGSPYVSWSDDSSGARQIYVKRWNGSGWEEVGSGSASGGGISNSGALSYNPSLAFASDGSLYLAWENGPDGGAEIWLRRWNGSSWEEMDGSGSGGGISRNYFHSAQPSVAIAPDDTPYVAWWDRSAGMYASEVYVRRWNGSSWEEVSPGSATGRGISNNNGQSYEPRLAFALDGTLYVTWHDNSGVDYEIYVRSWNGSSWAEMGTGSASGGGISNNSGRSWRPRLAVVSNGTPYITWTDESSGTSQIYVRRWNGLSWEEVGTGSATGGGVSKSSVYAAQSWIVIAPDGTPHVTWNDSRTSPIGEIYARSWNGSSWQEVGAGSASGGGISDNDGPSAYACPAFASDGTLYVAWDDASDGDREIYVRRWSAAPEAAFTWAPEPQFEGAPVQFGDQSIGHGKTIVKWSWDFGGQGTSSDQNPGFVFADNGTYRVCLTVTDSGNSTDSVCHDVNIKNAAPTVETLSAPLEPVDVNDQAPFTVNVTFSDPAGVNDAPYTCSFDFDNDGDDDTTVGGVTGTSCSAALSDETQPGYAEAGVYTAKVTVTDKDGDSGSATATEYVVVYDPSGGFVTGGGWIISPAGACEFEDCAYDTTGKANFGFVSKYKKGATVPTGNTEFNFSAGGLNFYSYSYDWLVVTGSDYARFKGAGTINGEGDYRFMLWAGDDETDTFRIRIWEEDELGNETDIYDNGFDQEIGSGSIVIHTK